MAEGFEPYHVPHQSRRDKLRVNNRSAGCDDNLAGFYDPSDLLSCTSNLHRQSFSLGANTTAGYKEVGMNLMNYVGEMSMMNPASAAVSVAVVGAASSGPKNSHMYLDPKWSVQLNPSCIQDINGSPCAYSVPHQNYRILDQSFQHGNEVMVLYKPEPLSMAHHHDVSSNSLATSCQSLSLSLSSHHIHSSELNSELNLQRCDSSMFSNSNTFKTSGGGGGGGYLVPAAGRIELSRSSLPLGPFTGYASVLKGSRFLKPTQQLLEELCDVRRGVCNERMASKSSLLEPPPSMESLSANGLVDDSLSCIDGGDQSRKKSRLTSMLDEVYKKYKQYYQEMQTVISSFESVAGLSTAAPFAFLAINSMCKHFRSLKNAITDQLQFSAKIHGKFNCGGDETQRVGSSGSGGYGERLFHGPGFDDQPLWRPQRGLPERAVSVLRAWLFEHFLHPYPTDTDKVMLARQTGLSRNQVSNWFINARVRLWKPMVEEIHMLETSQNDKVSSQREKQTADILNDQRPTSCPTEYSNTLSTQRTSEFPLKRTREDFTETPRRSEGPMNLTYGSLSHHYQLGDGVSNNPGVGGGVSLTLGLHQNSGGMSDSYPINAARRFGLDAHSEGYVVSGLGVLNRQLGRDAVGGQLLHDFVG